MPMSHEKVAANIKKLTGVSDVKAKKAAAKFMKKRKNKGGAKKRRKGKK